MASGEEGGSPLRGEVRRRRTFGEGGGRLPGMAASVPPHPAQAPVGGGAGVPPPP